jgi:tetratricopeptide (TPR) repeat protein
VTLTRTRKLKHLALAMLLAASNPAQALDLSTMWDFDHPEVSEQRFRSAMKTATGDDILILQTQIARSQGLRKDFVAARATLLEIEGSTEFAGSEARARWWLEMGRTWSSAAHAPATQTPEAKRVAKVAYEKAIGIARVDRIDDLQVDALHMLAFVDTDPNDRLHWDEQALTVVLASTQPAASRWEASIRNNIGVALHDLGRYDEALAQFMSALMLRERRGDAAAVRGARYMVAWDLRALGRIDEALSIQLELEQEGDAAHDPDRSVYEELETIYRGKGNAKRAAHYAALKARTPD